MDASGARAALVAAVMVGGGCVFGSPDYAGSAFRCDQDEPCPPGFSCVGDRCQATSDGGSPDGAKDGGPACSEPTIPLSDDFAGQTTGAGWEPFTANGTGLAEIDGELVVTLTTAFQSRFAGYDSIESYDVREHRMFVEVPVVGNGAAQTRLQARAGSGNLVSIAQQDGTLRFEVVENGSAVALSTMAYDPDAHRWWQIREEAGTVLGEISSDGVAWALLGSADTPAFLEDSGVQLSAGTSQNVSSPGEARFARFNVLPPDCP